MSKDNLSDIWNLRQRGLRDSERHKELIKRAIRKNGNKLITQYNIIKSDGTKKIKVPIKFLERYHFKYGDNNPEKGVGQGVDVKPGQVYRTKRPDKNAKGEPGDEEGEKSYEVDITIDELVSILIDELGLPWMEPTNQTVLESDNEEFSSRERKGIQANLDLKKSILENLKRNIIAGTPEIKNIHDEDLRYKVWEEEKEYHSNAAIYMLLDRSGSMDGFKTEIAKTFFFWMVQFLKRRYKVIDLVFIAHDVKAFRCTEDEFFKISSNGGTKCSSAFKLAYELIKENHSPTEWNNYIFGMSDGDSPQDDHPVALEYIEKLLELSRAIGYGEITSPLEEKYQWHSEDKLLSRFLNKKINRTRFVSIKLFKKEDVYEGLKKFFNIDGVSNKRRKL